MANGILVAIRGMEPSGWADSLRNLLPGRIVLATDDSGRFHGAAGDLDRVGYLLAWKMPQETLDRLRNLSLIVSVGAGVDHLFSLARLPNVPVTRIIDRDLTMRMTEYVVWQVLDQFRQGHRYRRLQSERRWHEYDQPAAHSVSVGLMGLGVLGTDAAEVLLRLGFKVRGWSRTQKTIAGVATFRGSDGLDPFLAGTDILVSLLPLTPETRGLIDRRLLPKLRKDGPLGGPILINAGRGGSHVEADLIAALKDGTLIGAGLDVFEREPLPEESPLWGMPNVTITPHCAAAQDANALVPQIVEEIVRFERGEPLRNAVDRESGY